MTKIQFPDLEKINFLTMMGGMKFNGRNWIQFRNTFFHAIKIHVPEALLILGYFKGDLSNGYIKIDANTEIAQDIAIDQADGGPQGAFNAGFHKRILEKLAHSCFEYNQYQEYEQHKNDYVCIIPCDINADVQGRGQRRRANDWEATWEITDRFTIKDPIGLETAKGLNVTFGANCNGAIGQANLVCENVATNAGARSRQISWRLHNDQRYITAQNIIDKQKAFQAMRFTPTYTHEEDEARKFKAAFIRSKDIAKNDQTYEEELQVILAAMIPQGRYEYEDYQSQMKLIDNNIRTTEAFFDALERVYEYFKEGNVGRYFRSKLESKQANYLNKRETYNNERAFGKKDYGVIKLDNLRCYICHRTGHYMNKCPQKEKYEVKNKKGNYQKNRDYKSNNRYQKKNYDKGNNHKKGSYNNNSKPRNKFKEEYEKAKRTYKDKVKRRLSRDEKIAIKNRIKKQLYGDQTNNKYKNNYKDQGKPEFKPGEYKPPVQYNTFGLPTSNEKLPGLDKPKFKKWCRHCKTDTHSTRNCYKYRKEEEGIEDPMVFNFEKGKYKETYSVEQQSDQNDHKEYLDYQDFQESKEWEQDFEDTSDDEDYQEIANFEKINI